MVAVAGSPASPVVLDRRRIETADTAILGPRQPYHAAERLGVERAAALIRQFPDSSTLLTLRSVSDSGPLPQLNGLAIMTTTDVNGFYQFQNLTPGTYEVSEYSTSNNVTSNAGTVNGTTDGVANLVEIDSILLKPADAGINYDFIIHFVE